MKRMMIALAGVLLFMPAVVEAVVTVDQQRTLNLEAVPKDVAVSLNGKWVYVLTDSGDLLVYSGDGELEGRLPVGPSSERLTVGPREDVVFVSDPMEKVVRVFALSLAQEIDVSGAPFQGPEDAPVEITVFSEFQCPYCARLAPLLDEVRTAYPETVKVVFKNYPLRNHPFAATAAAAALAADRQDAFWPFHDRLFEHQGELNRNTVAEIAESLGLDFGKLQRDMQDPDIAERIRKDIRDAQAAGVKGVPTVFVNGRRVRARTFEGISDLVEQELGTRSESSASGSESGE